MVVHAAAVIQLQLTQIKPLFTCSSSKREDEIRVKHNTLEGHGQEAGPMHAWGILLEDTAELQQGRPCKDTGEPAATLAAQPQQPAMGNTRVQGS